MRRDKYIAWARAQAGKVLSEEDYKTIIKAIGAASELSFVYTDKAGAKKVYSKVRPIEFFITPAYYAGIKKIEAKLNPIEPTDEILEEKIAGTVYLWVKNAVSGKKESFYAETIKAAFKIPTIVEACIDPSAFFYFWSQTIPV